MNFLKNYISESQLFSMTLTPAGGDKLNEVYRNIISIPVIYSSECYLENVVYLHYSLGDTHLYIICRDQTEVQNETYGYVVSNGEFKNAKEDYINLYEYLERGFLLDFDFEPIKVEELIKLFK